MKRRFLSVACACCAALASAASAQTPILTPSDTLIAVDIVPSNLSRYPAAENPAKAIDGIIPPMGSTTGNKYLNFGRVETGLLVTPASGATTINGIQLATANDGLGAREPKSYAVYGTNDPIDHLVADNGNSTGYDWTLISQGTLAPPATSNTLYPAVNFANTTAWASYRVLFPSLAGNDGCCMQVAEVRLLDGTNTNVLSPTDGVSAFELPQNYSSTPAAENVAKLNDGNTTTKYLNFGKDGSGFIVTPGVGPKAVNGFQLTTANDAPERDPSGWALYGTNDAIVSGQNSTINPENWTLLDLGVVDLPTARGALGPMVSVNNSAAYASYRLVFNALRNSTTANSMQVAEVQMFVPEPGSLVLALGSMVAMIGVRRKKTASEILGGCETVNL
jgi:hypothetical protein